ncbi:NAD(P)/FAD-dependent oxidoreductase [Pseudonocardia alaniniphila]|uniref:FAD-dependent oxidoreductase n=1 Tax=Pseudonocardia alaniniphila TaxID=75291 RepID=A0ABS9TCX9_9PSEU|nr:FAD-dependent oxidoreductase [Pseudonocardia alaniniphila]MCH6166258.1 FAD-dependent oxidoreductase [Pseudonocardia alaniniphila]
MVIVGTSVAGVRTAQALRSIGYDGNVVLVGEENALPCDKPPLSKGLLTGALTTDDVRLLTEQRAAESDIQLLLGRSAVRLDVAARKIELSDGTRLPFDDVVIATGARARSSPWGCPAGVHTLRTLDDAVALHAELCRGGPVAVIGAGFIGCEVAATARAAGVDEVTMLDSAAGPLGRSLPPAIGDRFAWLHEEHGVRTLFGVKVSAVDRVGDELVLRLGNGSTLQAATVVVGIGAVPNDDWLRDSELNVDDGVLCDQCGRAAPHVYAVGDVARWYRPRWGTSSRIEHWTNAVEQAACVAHNIAQPESPREHDPFEYVWSDQYDWKIQILGRTGADLGYTTFEHTGKPAAFAVLFRDSGGACVGVLTVNWPRALVTCRRALSRGATWQEVRDSLAESSAHVVPSHGR